MTRRVDAIGDIMRRGRLRSQEHIERNCNADCLEEECNRLVVEEMAPFSSPNKTWRNTVFTDMGLLRVDHQNIHDRRAWDSIK